MAVRPRTALTPLDLLRRRSPTSSEAPRDFSRDPVVGAGVYADGRLVERVDSMTQAAARARAVGGFVWIGLHEPSSADLADIAELFDLHPLAVEDAVNAHQRPKLERYDDMLFLVLKTTQYVEHEELTATSNIINTGEVMVFLGRDFVITVRHGDHNEMKELRDRLEGDPDLLAHGPAVVMHAVADMIVDNYLDVATDVENDIDELEASVFSASRHGDVARIYQLKRELLELKRAVLPLSSAIRTLYDRPLALIPDDIREYFRDVDDHLTHVRDNVAGADDLLTSILQASIARLSLTENEDMRKITSWAAIAAVPTAIAGIYGMNFKHMPELTWTYGYPLILLVIFGICLLLYRGFKRNGWL